MIHRVLRFYTKFFALWVILFAVAAYFLPGPFLLLKPFNKYFFALTMFGIGAVLSPEDFKRIAQTPAVVLIGTVAQFTMMPLGAFAVSKLFDLPPALATGLILAGCAPGAMSSNVMSYISRADTAYSVSLTTVSTLLCPLLTPGLTRFLAGSIMPVDFLAMFFDVIITVIVPLWAGFFVRRLWPRQVDKVREIFPAVSVTFIIFICALVMAGNRDRLSFTGPDSIGPLLPAVLAAAVILNIFGMSAGYAVGAAFKMAPARRRTLSIEIGMQNAGLGTILALKHFGPSAAIAPAVFVFVCIITASAMAELWRRNISLTA